MRCSQTGNGICWSTVYLSASPAYTPFSRTVEGLLKDCLAHILKEPFSGLRPTHQSVWRKTVSILSELLVQTGLKDVNVSEWQLRLRVFHIRR